MVKIAYKNNTTSTARAKITATMTFQFNFQKLGVQSIIWELLPVMLSKSKIKLNWYKCPKWGNKFTNEFGKLSSNLLIKVPLK